MAHSSGASRLALPQRAVQPGGGGVLAGAAPLSAGVAAGGAGLFGVVCADLGGALDLGGGCCAWLGKIKLNVRMAATRTKKVAGLLMDEPSSEDRPADRPSFAS
jgi:hypothetical protein